MTRLYGVDYDAGKALFEIEDKYVVVDINAKDVVDTPNALTASSWMKVSSDFEYPQVWRELAEASTATLEVVEESAPAPERKFRVPDNVRREASQAIDWVNGFERAHSAVGMGLARKLSTATYVSLSDVVKLHRFFNRMPSHVTEASGWNPGHEGYPTNERIRFAMRGGVAGREWASRIALKHTMTAAGGFGAPAQSAPEAETEPDGNKIHKFVPSPESPEECSVCGRDRKASVHSAVTASAFVYDGSCDYYGVGVDPDSTVVTGLLVNQPDGSWALRVDNDWSETDPPSDDDVIIMLDEESAYRLADIIDDVAPTDPSVLPYELAMLNPHEAALFAHAESEIDWEMVDRVFDIYDSTERSVNAKKQVRGPGGRFGDNPNDPESKKIDVKPTKARLPQALPLVTDVASLIRAYIASNGGQAAVPADKRVNPNVKNPVQASALDPAYINSLIEFADDAAPAATEARPLYLAIVDKVDTEAVLDLVSLKPGQPPTMWKRDKGQWVQAPDILADLQGTEPPPVVELKDDTIVKNVIEQVDKATAQDEAEEDAAPVPGATEQNPDGSSGAKPDANPDQHPVAASFFPVDGDDMDLIITLKSGEEFEAAGVFQVESLTAAGHDVIFLENRRTPKIVPSGKKYEAKPSEGKIVKRRKATQEEEKTIRSGGWVRVNEHGKTPKDSDYKSSKKSKIRPQHNSNDELADRKSSDFVKCPRCGSNEVSHLTGPDQPRCAKCGYHVALKDSAENSVDEFFGVSSDHRDKLAKKGYALPDGSFPIPDVAHLKKAIQAFGRAKNQNAAKNHIIKRARALGRVDLIPENWEAKTASAGYAMWGPNGEIMSLVAEGGADRNRGGAEKLRRYWTKGEGGLKIAWNTPGDWTRCYKHLRKYLGTRAAGYCSLRHKEMTGRWPGERDSNGNL